VLINRILIVGLGSIGMRHLRLARELMPKADIRVFRHKTTNQIPEYSNGIFSSIEKAILFSPQIAVIANPSSLHIATAKKFAEIGAHLFIEKPLSNSLVGVSQLLEICKKKNTYLLTAYNLRFLPSLQRFKDFIGENIIGDISSVHCEVGQYLPSWRIDRDYKHSVSAQKKLGGGVLLELSHEIDYLRWIFGEVQWVKASLSKQSNLEIDVEDTAHIIMGFMPLNNSNKLIASVNLDFIRRDTTRLCTAIGEHGSLRWNGITGEVLLFKPEDGKWSELYCYKNKQDESYLNEWSSFLAVITKGKAPMINIDEGLEVLKIIEAIRQSSLSSGIELKEIISQKKLGN
jgi:predicted dehydrogenase